MKLMKWDHFREMEDMFDRYSRGLGWPRRGSQSLMAAAEWAPRIDISETPLAYHIEIEIPEVKKDDVRVTVENGVLTIRGERRQEKENSDRKYLRVERFYGTFTRSFALPDHVDPQGIEASFREGMLYLEMPKMKDTKPKRIEVQVNAERKAK